MKKLALIALALSILNGACTRKETVSVNMWRFAEPRLTGVDGYRRCTPAGKSNAVVQQVECKAAPNEVPEEGFGTPPPDTPEAALQKLPLREFVTQAIVTLETQAKTNPLQYNNLAAAYYIRAQNEDRPEDLLSALENVQRSLQVNPRMPEARFNLALIEEALGLHTDAAAAWEEFRKNDRSHWGEEAAEHLARLERERADDANTKWAAVHKQLPAALAAGDQAMVARLIARFPLTAQRYLEEELLPQWAADPSPANVRQAQVLATELSRRSDDRYAVDLVNVVAQAKNSPQKVSALRAGHSAYGQGRRQEKAFEDATTAFRSASRWLKLAGSPLHVRAKLRLTVREAFHPNDFFRGSKVLSALLSEAERDGHRSLAADLRANQGFFLQNQSRFVDSIDAFDSAVAAYEQLHDHESVAILQARRIGALRTVGLDTSAFRQAILETRCLSETTDLQDRHFLLGETAQTSVVLQHPRAAGIYQAAAVRLIRAELATTTDPKAIERLQINLAVALRQAAGIEVALGNIEYAARDLDEAIRLSNENKEAADPALRDILRAHEREVRAQSMVAQHPLTAAADFTEALNLLGEKEYYTYRATLMGRRADAERHAGNLSGAKHDLENALSELHEEERTILAHRKPGEREDLWAAYFSRFQETYRLLIRQLVDEGRTDDAFRYMERARAAEPLDLAGKLSPRSSCFGQAASSAPPINIRDVQAALPAGIVVIDYCVLEDGTLVWLISHDRVAFRVLRARRASIARWSDSVQNAAIFQNTRGLEDALTPPFTELLEKPLALAREMTSGSTVQELVIVPDGPMHGLPFSALRNGVTASYLIEELAVSIQGSAALYLAARCRDAELPHDAKPSILLVGNPKINRRLSIAEGLVELPGAEHEVDEIAKTYPSLTRTLRGDGATVGAFLAEAPKSTVIHVAAHAVANYGDPSHSSLLFAPSVKPLNSGALYAEDLVRQLRLPRTALVVLSACSSGGGAPIGPEGVAPLVRPWIGAGVPAVIGSLWPVSDATPEDLMVSFHRYYRSGEDAATAMRSAQLDLLHRKDERLQSPLAWASFEVIGHASSPFARSP